MTTTQSSTALQANVDSTALTMGKQMNSDQENLMTAYSFKDTATPKELSDLASKLGLNPKDTNLSAKGLQVIAEQRFQQTSSRLTLFSNLMDRIAQLRQQLVNNLKG